MPPMPDEAPRLRFAGSLRRPAASVYAVSMSSMAVIMFFGVGDTSSNANILPVTCGDVANVPDESAIFEKPVNAAPVIGLMPRSPVMDESGTVETPVLARIANEPAVRRSTVGVGAASRRRPGGAAVVSMVAASSVTAVCASTRPLSDAPVMNAARVLTRKTPSRCAPAPASTKPATCQKMFSCLAPPSRMTLTPAAAMTSPDVCMMKMSVALPLMVMSAANLMSTVHL
mmetsp:Transcript_17373/g.58686  ORF Transcript_17373/g.58686 Transcript_17373/m.58686 type:complete len:229 (-) Transcript_17373:509-1195(-)